ncbi:MAG: outer membrane protein transport protein [Deltaproteobacteria bacterium]|nr:outer membrane protein transport protein [Deltaproteobacteria bacterium]
MRRVFLLLIVALVNVSSGARAGGFLMYEHGATATGMADARTASSDDVNAIYFNPAAITELDGLQLQLGVTGFLPYIEYTAARNPDPERQYTRWYGLEVVQINDGENDANAKLKGFSPFHLYVAYKIPKSGVSVGFGVNNPFGLGTYWPGDWDGRFITTESELTTFINQPVVALDIAELAGFKEHLKLSVAVGYNLVYATARMGQQIDLRVGEMFINTATVQGAEGSMLLTGDAIGHGWNVALFAEIPDLLAVGASLRSGISLPLSGTARFWFNDAGLEVLRNPALASSLIFPDQTGGRVTIDLPMNMNFGIAFLGIDRLKLALDFYIALFESYDELDVKFDCVDQEPACSLDMPPIVNDWGTSWQVSLGAEYRVWDGLTLRCGYGTSFSPIPDETLEPSLPDSRQDNISFGAGYRGSFWKVDLGYMLALFEVVKDNDVGDWGDQDHLIPNGKANGTYKTTAHMLALSLSAWFF